MWIREAYITNYKCFKETGPIQFSSGINLIIGQNSSGKSAFLNALSLRFAGSPHLSKTTLSQNKKGNRNKSTVSMKFCASKNEVLSTIGTMGGTYSFATPFADTRDSGNFEAKVLKYLEKDELSCEVTFSGALGEAAQMEGGRGLSANFPYDTKILVGKVAYLTLADDRKSISHVSDYALGQAVEGSVLGANFATRVYSFKAERITVSQVPIGVTQLLNSDASNLPEVLHNMQSSNSKFSRYISEVNRILPNVRDVSIRNTTEGLAEIRVTSYNPEDDIQDLYFKISECGTGVGQILSLVYIIVFQKEPSVVIIDEPNSFLHPGATRKLIELMKKNDRHQYIISSHSPEVISAVNPDSMLLIRWTEDGSIIETSDAKEISEIKNAMDEVGFKISDVFGVEKICWVEGPTEEKCFPLLAERVLGMNPSDIRFLAVRNTSDFDGNKHRVIALHTYEKLTKGDILTPPAVKFIFDLEDENQNELDKLSVDAKAKMAKLNRRCYENFLLDSSVISGYLTELMVEHNITITPKQVEDIFSSTSGVEKYFGRRPKSTYGTPEWLVNVDGPKVLKLVFSKLTDTRHNFDKIPHSVNITKWIIDNNPVVLKELTDFLGEQLAEGLPQSA